MILRSSRHATPDRRRGRPDLPTAAADLDLPVRRGFAPSSLGLWLRGSGR